MGDAPSNTLLNARADALVETRDSHSKIAQRRQRDSRRETQSDSSGACTRQTADRSDIERQDPHSVPDWRKRRRRRRHSLSSLWRLRRFDRTYLIDPANERTIRKQLQELGEQGLGR